jgi:heme/copper-type cytochrome/quinol oxidase subunit 2
LVESQMISSASKAAIEQMPFPTLLALFLFPGALTTAVYVVLAAVVEGAGFPPIAALLVAILIVLVPFELAVIFRSGGRDANGIASAVPYRRSMAVRDWVWLVPALIVAAFVGFGLDGVRTGDHRCIVRLAARLVRATDRC